MQIYHVEVDNEKTIRWYDKPLGKLHRVDGPACEWANGGKYWYYHGTKLDCSSQEEFEKLLKLKAFW